MEKSLKTSIIKLENWISSQRYSSYDHYDFWSSKFGIISRGLYYKNRHLGFPIMGFLYLIDAFLPNSRMLFFKKEISCEALPYFARGYFRLYEVMRENAYLVKAIQCLDLLAKKGVETKSGIGWGLHFDWPSRAFIPKNTPCITITSNAVDAFLEGYKVTKDITYMEIAIKAAEFAIKDLNRKNLGRIVAVSYTPICNTLAINANSFCVKMLYDVSVLSEDHRYAAFADRILGYILQQQNADGSWFYRDKSQNTDNFIDNLHTCFVLEHLYSIFLENSNQRIKVALEKGYSFFVNTFINNDYSCKHFYKYPNPTGVKVDIRSCAETIYCCALLSPLFPDALNIAKQVAYWTMKNMQDPCGFFYFRSYRVGKNKMPYMRWGQAPMFNALTYLLKKLEG